MVWYNIMVGDIKKRKKRKQIINCSTVEETTLLILAAEKLQTEVRKG